MIFLWQAWLTICCNSLAKDVCFAPLLIFSHHSLSSKPNLTTPTTNAKFLHLHVFYSINPVRCYLFQIISQLCPSLSSYSNSILRRHKHVFLYTKRKLFLEQLLNEPRLVQHNLSIHLQEGIVTIQDILKKCEDTNSDIFKICRLYRLFRVDIMYIALSDIAQYLVISYNCTIVVV